MYSGPVEEGKERYQKEVSFSTLVDFLLPYLKPNLLESLSGSVG